ncbi:hypothetical protein PM082_019695 [Marasmius tenuissimus]|nr:hypothetical protein PM082_019695 [Marasmius tenuissimus]
MHYPSHSALSETHMTKRKRLEDRCIDSDNSVRRANPSLNPATCTYALAPHEKEIILDGASMIGNGMEAAVQYLLSSCQQLRRSPRCLTSLPPKFTTATDGPFIMDTAVYLPLSRNLQARLQKTSHMAVI